MTLNLRNIHVYQARATVTDPLCVSIGDVSLTIWQNEDGSVAGFLAHAFNEDGKIVDVAGKGLIPAEYAAFEENARNWSDR